MALRKMARHLMLTRAMTAALPALKETTIRSNLGRAAGVVEEVVLDQASMQEFCRLAADNYIKQVKVARAAGVGLAGAAALSLAGFGIHRLNSSSNQ